MTLVVQASFALPDGGGSATQHLMWCPGCQEVHAPTTNPEGGYAGPVWQWDGHLTWNPSLLVTLAPGKVCHSFIRDGQWEFLPDSWHDLAGTTVPMVPVPEWLERE